MAKFALIGLMVVGLSTAACGGHRRGACGDKDGRVEKPAAAAPAPSTPAPASPAPAAPTEG